MQYGMRAGAMKCLGDFANGSAMALRARLWRSHESRGSRGMRSLISRLD
jgi:hypothetical protein